jgi:hypothetical protein
VSLFDHLAWLDGEKGWFLPLSASFWQKTVRLGAFLVWQNDSNARQNGFSVR